MSSSRRDRGDYDDDRRGDRYESDHRRDRDRDHDRDRDGRKEKESSSKKRDRSRSRERTHKKEKKEKCEYLYLVSSCVPTASTETCSPPANDPSLLTEPRAKQPKQPRSEKKNCKPPDR